MTGWIYAHAGQTCSRLDDQVVVSILVEVSDNRRSCRNVRQPKLSDDLTRLGHDGSVVHSEHEDILSSELVGTEVNHFQHRHHVDVDGCPHILSGHERVTGPIDTHRSRLQPVRGGLDLPIQTAVVGVGREETVADEEDCIQHVDTSISLISLQHALEHNRRSGRQLLLALQPPSSHAQRSLRDATDHVAVLGGRGADGLVKENVSGRSSGGDPRVTLRVEGVADKVTFRANYSPFTDDCFEPVDGSISIDVCMHHVGRERELAERPAGVKMQNLDAVLAMDDEGVGVLGGRWFPCNDVGVAILILERRTSLAALLVPDHLPLGRFSFSSLGNSSPCTGSLSCSFDGIADGEKTDLTSM
mmetsp:Transcript_43422/g.137263  ORF Transcript_43422/g.137263 Transcript_43422/m.137263 type:complete len:359 (+) Transcript_43422:323-1399(+)